MRTEFLYDLSWKVDALRFSLKEAITRRDWTLHKVRPEPQSGVSIINGGTVQINGEAYDRWGRESIYYAEFYISTVLSFFDILAKAFDKNWKPGQDLYFKPWIDKLSKRNFSDSFIKGLHAFKTKQLVPISKLRIKVIHEMSLARNVTSFFNLNWKKGGPLERKFLLFELDGKEIEIIDYLEAFAADFDKLLSSIDANKMKEY